MPAETIFPAWFRRLPIYTTMQRDARLADETQRAALAAERDQLRAIELKDAPKRQRAIDNARLVADAAREKFETAAAALRGAEQDAAGPAHRASWRMAQIDRTLADLSDPCIRAALASLLDRFELTRRREGPGAPTVALLEQIAAARRKLEGLTITAGVDATAEVAAIMTALEPQPAAHGFDS